MKINFKRIFAITFLSIIGILVIVNIAISYYLRGKAETVGSKLFDSQVSVGSVSFYYYPLAVTFNDVFIKKNSDKSLVKSLKIKYFDLRFDLDSLFLKSDLFLINYARAIEPEITYAASEFTLESPDDDALKVCSKDSLNFEEVDSIANEQALFNYDLYQFIITKLFITNAKFILIDGHAQGKEKKIEISDTAIDIVDNFSGKMVEEHLKNLVQASINSKLIDPKPSEKKDVKTDEEEDLIKDEIQRNIFE